MVSCLLWWHGCRGHCCESPLCAGDSSALGDTAVPQPRNSSSAQCQEWCQWEPLCTGTPSPSVAVPAPPGTSSPGNPEQVEPTTVQTLSVPKGRTKRSDVLKRNSIYLPKIGQTQGLQNMFYYNNPYNNNNDLQNIFTWEPIN